MAWYYITYSCGHDGREQIYGPTKNRQWIANKKAEGLCPECRNEERKARIESEREIAIRESEEMGLPDLQGTEKQVAWAVTIRYMAVKAVNVLMEKIDQDSNLAPHIERSYLLTVEDIHDVMNHIVAEKTSAAWWIDNRHSFSDSIYTMLREFKYIKEKIEKDGNKKEEKEFIEEINAEITVRPEGTVKTETVAEIMTEGNIVKIIFPERREDFRKIVKNNISMIWNGSYWTREIPWYAGTVEDRAAEAGHRLLAAGFIVRIPDETVRQKAINGKYEVEHTRWIFRRGGGGYDGWFSIWWKKPDDFYNAARKIAGSKWDKPFVVVPPEQFEQVLDFAERHGFRLSEKAQAVVEAARKAKEEAILVSPEPPKRKEKVVADTRPPILDVPEVVEIDDELRDDN